MSDLREFNEIAQFLGTRGGRKTRELEQALDDEPEEELLDLDRMLSVVDHSEDRTKEWKDQIRNGRYDDAAAEIALIYWLRTNHGRGAVSIKSDLPGTGKDFDIRMETEETTIWIEVTNEDWEERYNLPGYNPTNKTAEKVERKIKNKLVELSQAVPDEDFIVLALHTEVPLIQRSTIEPDLDRLQEEWSETVDGLITFTGTSPVDFNIDSMFYDLRKHGGKQCHPLYNWFQ